MDSPADRSHGGKRKRDETMQSPRKYRPSPLPKAGRRENPSWNQTEQAKINQLQEEERHREYLAQEGDFVLKQKRKASEIRVKEGRARPIDWLTITLRIIDPTKDLINDDDEDQDLDFVAPESVFEGLEEKDLRSLEKDIEEFIQIEKNPKNRDYWKTMIVICKDRRKKLGNYGPQGRAIGSVSSDIDRLLQPKSYEELEKLEKQVRKKLDSDEPIDTDYWQQLLNSLLVYKAQARLKNVYQSVIDAKLERLRKENAKIAQHAKRSFSSTGELDFTASQSHEPVPLLQVDPRDKSLKIVDEREFLSEIAFDRRRVSMMRYVPLMKHSHGRAHEERGNLFLVKQREHGAKTEEAKPGISLFDREVAKGVEEDEEVFAGEEEVETKNKDLWMGKYRPRKPKYFNRVQMGYEWNKYNQTHYDHDNPPPKVVQGYKFHVFYPDLIDKNKAPTYKITREGGRKKGQTLAPAGEEDTCVIRFMSGPPYEDVAFRIIDRDWDYSAKHDRGFRSTFENGVLTLHFSFKKVYYRK